MEYLGEHRFRFRQGDFELELVGSREYVEAQLAVWMSRLNGTQSGEGGESATATVPAPTPAKPSDPVEDLPRVSPSFRPRVNTSLEDFVAMKAATAPVDVLVVAAYYLEKYGQLTAYTHRDLQEKLTDLKAWECQAADDVIPLAVEMGYLETLRDNKYTLTFKGQNYVRDGLSG